MTAKRKPNEIDEPTLPEMAIETLNTFDGDVVAATESLIHELRTDNEKFVRVVSSAVREACKSYVSRAHRNQRADIIERMLESKARESRIGATAIALVEENLELLMNYPMRGGKKLRHATREDVRWQAAFHDSIAKDATWKAKWFSKIASFMTNDEDTVSDFMDSKTVTKFYEEARS